MDRGKQLEFRYDYWHEQLAVALKAWDSDLSPSEFHGAMCGLISSGHLTQASQTLSAVASLLGHPVDDRKLLLEELAQRLFDGLESEAFEMKPLIHEDDLTRRLGELAHWSSGFLLGAGWGPNSQSPSREVKEIYEDLISISRVEADSEIDESDLDAVAEHARLSAHLLYLEHRNR